METKRITINSECKCGNSQIILQTGGPLLKNHIVKFTNSNYKQNESYIKSGILYLENDDLIMMGPLGSNRMQIKCKRKDCDKSISQIESIIKDI
jgi:hypothetical protein